VRWFTRERYEDPDFDDWDAVRSGYWAYIDSIREGLPSELRRFLEINLHDAVVDVAEIDLVQRTARIRFLAGNSASFVDCQYRDADFGDSNLKHFELATEARSPLRDMTGVVFGWGPLASVLYDEVALVGERFQHSFLIYAFGDFTVRFQDFALTVEPAGAGGLPERSTRFFVRNEWTED
jgi:hypothetical protein